jgi:hypothetical protein
MVARRAARNWLIGGIAALLLLVIGAAVVAPYFIDTPAVRAEIQRRLDAALGGRIGWQALQIRLLPAPHGELRQVRIDIPDALAAEAERVRVDLRLWPLLSGRAEIAAVTLERPRIRVAATGGGESDAPLDVMAAYRAVAEPAARALQTFASDTTFRLSNAELDGPIALRNVNAAARSGAAGLDLELQADGALWKRLRVEGRLSYADLAAKLIARVEELDLSAIALPVALEGHVSANGVLEVGQTWRADIETTRSTAAVQLAQLPWKLSVDAARIGVTDKRVSFKDVRGKLGESTFADLAAQLELDGKARLAGGTGRASLRLEQWYPWLAKTVTLGPVTGLAGGLDVTLHRLALPFDRPQAIDFEAVAVPRGASATLGVLPGPVAIAGGAVRVDSRSVRLDKVALAMLDAKALLAGTIAYRGPKVELAASDGAIGDAVLAWALRNAGAPEALELKAPVRFTARRIGWTDAGLAVEADLGVDAGPALGVTLGWTPQRLELRALTIKDAQSDATLTALVGKDLFQAGFSGVLHAQSVASLRRQPVPRTGRVQGKLRFTLDQARPLRSVADGKLEVADVDLSLFTGRPAVIERVELAAERSTLRIARARAVIDEQALELSGEIRGTDQGPVIDARLESPGVVMEKLLPPAKPAAEKKESKLWPLPVTGRVAVRAGFVQLGEQRIEPLEGSAVLEAERVRLDVQAAKMCGVSFPLQMDATPERYAVAGRLAMKDEPFEKALHCLTGGTVQITGNADLAADLRTQGRNRDELLRNLAGNAEAELRKGRVERFALIGNIMSLQNLTSIRDPRDIEKGFLYRSMTAKGRFEGGEFLVEEGFFDSDAARIAVNGKVDLLGDRSHLNVLVGLLSSVDRITGAIPILGDVLGGTLIAVPVSVSGDIRDPLVVPLGPRAISDRLLGVFERTLKLPGKLVPADPAKKPER